MQYKRELWEILKEVMNTMTFVINFKGVTNNGDGSWTFTGACDTLHAQAGFAFDTTGYINAGNTPETFSVTITDVTDSTITVKATDPRTTINDISILIVSLYTPYFFHGSPIEVNKELINKSADAAEKTPLLYLLENLEEDFNDGDESAIERESPIRLFFLTQRNAEDWLIDDAYAYAVRPMARLMEHYISKLRRNKLFEMDEFTYTKTDHTKFGVYIANKGVEKSLFSDDLAGVELSCTLKIRKQDQCSCED